MGRRMKFKSCNTEPCSKLKKDFRDEQCAVFDGKHFNINGLPPNVRWVPKYSGSKYISKATRCENSRGICLFVYFDLFISCLYFFISNLRQ